MSVVRGVAMLVKLDNEYQENLSLEAWLSNKTNKVVSTPSIYNWKLFEFITNWKLNNCQWGRNIEHDSPKITKKSNSIIFNFSAFNILFMWILPHNKEPTAAFHNFPNLNFTQPGVEAHHEPSTRKLLELLFLSIVKFSYPHPVFKFNHPSWEEIDYK